MSNIINKVAVIGAGVMGSAIAAQIANAGLPVILLDIKLEDKDLAQEAVARMLKTDPAPFMHPSNARLITTGNLEDDLDLIGDCDWIVEVVLEDIKIKHKTYALLQKNRKKGSIISSNTSTIPLHQLIEGQTEDFQKDFTITHFFNPPRYMRLLELVVGEKTRPDAVETVREFCDVKLGKGVVVCKDTPGFIGNRLGVYWLTTGVNEAFKQGVSIEIADAVMGKPCGIPKTGIFGLIDLVGIDLMPKLSESLLSSLADNDAYREQFVDYKFIHDMIKAGYTGRKGHGGFYRLNPDAPKGVREKQALSLDATTFSQEQYRKAQAPDLASIAAGRKGLRAVVTTDDAGGRYAWSVLKQTLSYASELVGEVADTIYDIDEAMKLGYNWKQGPFEMMDALGDESITGPAWLASELEKSGVDVPDFLRAVGAGTFYRIENGTRQYFGTDGQYHDIQRSKGVLLLRDIKLRSDPIAANKSASIWDIGDGVLCFEKTSKMNTFDEGTFDMLDQVIKIMGDGTGQYKALVIYNESSHFSAGANLGLALFMVNIAMWSQVQGFIDRGQKTLTKLKFSPFPVVSAPSGMALGGGCEILLNADAVQAHAETYTGLVEVGVGVIPGWGGCKEMILRFQEREAEKHAKSIDGESFWLSPEYTPMGAVRQAFEVIAMAQVSKSAADAKSIGYLRKSDGITMNRDRLLYDAKCRALDLADGYEAPVPREDIRLPGPSGKMALDLAVLDLVKSGKATPYDIVVSEHVATVLSGGADGDWMNPKSENDILALEQDQFMSLLHNEGTTDRIAYMLDHGKPLRN